MPKNVKPAPKQTAAKSAPAKVADAPVATTKAAPVKVEAVAPVPVVAASVAVAAPAVAEVVAQENTVATELTAVLEQLNSLRKVVAALETRVRNVQRDHTKEVRTLTKAASKKVKRTADANRKPSGFAKPSKLSEKLCSFLGVSAGSEMPRTEVTRQISAYIKAQNLQKSEDKKFFTPDNKMKAILSPLEGDHRANGYSFFNLQKYIKHNFTSVQATA